MRKILLLCLLFIFINNAWAQPLYTISQIKGINAKGVADSLKVKCKLKGVVFTQNLTGSGLQFGLYDATGGIYVISNKSFSYKPKRGDSVLIAGVVAQFYGLTELKLDSGSLTLINAGNKLKTPLLVVKPSEANEGDYIHMDSISLMYPKQWDTTGNNKKGYFMATATKGKDSFYIRVDRQTNAWTLKAPVGKFPITGISYQYDTKTPYLEYYCITPRDSFDIYPAPPAPPKYFITKIRDVQANDALGYPANFGDTCKLRALVLSENFDGFGLNFGIEDSTGATIVFSNKTSFSYYPKRGDSIWVSGKVAFFRGVNEVNVDTVTLISSGHTVHTPALVTMPDESTESHLIRLDSLIFYDISKWTKNTGANGFAIRAIRANHTSDTVTVKIDESVDLYAMNIPTTGAFNLIGIGSQTDNTSPYTSGYQVMPRNAKDLTPLSPTVNKSINLYTISQIKSINATTGMADSVNVRCFLQGVVTSPDISRNRLLFAMKDATGAITVTHINRTLAYLPQLGDSIKIRGIINQQEGLTQITLDSQVIKMTPVAPLKPLVVNKPDEKTESDFIEADHLSIIDPNEWDSAKAVGNSFIVHTLNPKGDTVTLRILRGVDSLFHSSAPTGTYINVKGIGNQQDASAPYLSSYHIVPRMLADVSVITAVSDNNNIYTINIHPNPTKDLLNFNFNSAENYNATLVVTDLAGREIISRHLEVTHGNNNEELNTSALPVGMYFVKIVSARGGTSAAYKFIKTSE